MSRTAGEIAIIRFPRADLHNGKHRPVLLLAKLPGPYDDWLVSAVTSQLRHKVEAWDDIIATGDPDFSASGLRASSLVRLGKLLTVEEQTLAGALGRISEERLRTVLQRLADYLEHSARG